MGLPDRAHTHGSGGSGLGTAVLVVLGAALAVRLAGPVAAAVSQLVYVLMIVVAVAAGAGRRRGGVFIWRRRTRPKAACTVLLPPQVRAAQAFPAPQRRVIEAPAQMHVHHHWHGVTDEEVAAIIRHQEAYDE